MGTIQVREVPDEVVKKLKIRAVKRGQSLQEYMRSHLIEEVSRPSVEELFAEIEAREDSGSRLDSELTARSLRELRDA